MYFYRDLLNGSSEKLEIRMNLEGSREIPNLITTQVTTMEEVMKVIKYINFFKCLIKIC